MQPQMIHSTRESCSDTVAPRAGFPEHGVEVNATKTRLSFDMVVGGAVLPRNEYVTPNGARFIKWCGLLINDATLNVQVSHGF